MYLLIKILFTIPIILLWHLVGFILELRLGADNFEFPSGFASYQMW